VLKLKKTNEMELKINNKFYSFPSPVVMGIVNCTPDSFFEGSRKNLENEVLSTVEKHLSEGAKIIDLGAYSTRPNAQFVSVSEEIERLKNPLKWIRKKFPDCLISIDTFRSEVAKFSLENGANIVNDISGGMFDEKILEVVAKFDVPYIAMHLQGTKETMHQPYIYQNITQEVGDFFEEKVKLYRQKGIQQIILDPGFGFSKNNEQNFELLRHLEQLSQRFDLPLLVGLSRKRTIWKILRITPIEALNGTTVLNTVALLKGANILRVHDVKEAIQAVQLLEKLK